MSPIIYITLTILGIVASVSVAVWSTNKANGRARESEREQQQRDLVVERDRAREELRAMLDATVGKRLDQLGTELTRLWNYQGTVDRRITANDQAHWELVGFLKGKRCLTGDVCINREKDEDQGIAR